MEISFKKILMGAMVVFLPVFFLVNTLNYVHAEPPKTAAQSSKEFSVPSEFKGNFNLLQNLIDQYNIISNTPNNDTKSLDDAKKGLYHLIRKTYGSYDDRVRALCLFYVSKNPDFLDELKDKGVDSVENLISIKDFGSDAAVFDYLDGDSQSGNSCVGTIYACGWPAPDGQVGLIPMYF